MDWLKRSDHFSSKTNVQNQFLEWKTSTVNYDCCR